MTVILTGLIAIHCSMIYILSFVPPVSRDALTHHLLVPKLYLQHGGMYEIPDIVFSYYPMNLDLLYIIPLFFDNDIVPKYIHFAFALVTAALIYHYLKRRLSLNYGLVGALFFLSIPVILKLSISVYVDLGLICFSTAAFLCLLKWVDSGFLLKHFVFSAIFCGLALGTKYNGLITLFILSCMVPIVYLRRNEGALKQIKAIGYFVFFILISLTIFSPWMIKNCIWTGNPVYPLYDNWFNPESHPAISYANVDKPENQMDNLRENLSHFTVRSVVYGESVWETALIPFRIFFQGKDDNPKYFDGKLNPFLFILAILSIVPGLNDNSETKLSLEKKLFFCFSILYLLFVFLQIDMRIRWISPIIPPMVILSIFGLERVHRFVKSIQGSQLISIGVPMIIAIAMLFINIKYTYAIYLKVDPLPYIFGQIDRDTYIDKFRPEYELIRYANHHIPKSSLILSLFIGNRRYYFERNVVLDLDLFKKSVIVSNSINQISLYMKNHGVTHLLIRYDLLANWIERNLSPEKQTLLLSFLHENTMKLKANERYGLFELK